jgi:hypothetical protein
MDTDTNMDTDMGIDIDADMGMDMETDMVMNVDLDTRHGHGQWDRSIIRIYRNRTFLIF